MSCACRWQITRKTIVNRETLWPIARERAVLDREDFLDAWSGTGDSQVIDDTNVEIARFNAIKGKTFKDSMATDREGVRLALLCAESWYSGSADAQVGREKHHATAMYKRVNELRLKLFGKNKLEEIFDNSVAVPIHKIKDLEKSGLTPRDFLATLDQQ